MRASCLYGFASLAKILFYFLRQALDCGVWHACATQVVGQVVEARRREHILACMALPQQRPCFILRVRPPNEHAWKAQVAGQVVKARSRELTKVVDSFTTCYDALVGTRQHVTIVDTAADGHHLVGHTDTYCQVLLHFHPRAMSVTACLFMHCCRPALVILLCITALPGLVSHVAGHGLASGIIACAMNKCNSLIRVFVIPFVSFSKEPYPPTTTWSTVFSGFIKFSFPHAKCRPHGRYSLKVS